MLPARPGYRGRRALRAHHRQRTADEPTARLERLRELTGLDPARPDDRERLGLGIKAQLVLDALDRTAA